MDREAEFDQVLGLIYESTLAPEGLPAALAAMTSLLDGDTCHLVGWERGSGVPSLSISTGLPETVGPEYATHYAHIDPRRQLALTQTPNRLLNCREHFDDRFVSRSEFFQDYLIPKVGIHYLLGTGDLLAHSEQVIMIGFQRYVGHRPFSTTESKLLERLLPHLRRALQLTMLLEKRSEEKRLGNAVAEISNLAILALSSSGRVLWTNQHGEALLRDSVWFSQVHGLLQARDPGRNAALRQVLRETSVDGKPRHINLGADATGTAHCCLTLMALPPDNNAKWLSTSDTALLALVSTTIGQRVASVKQLMSLFRLTAAEARVARALAHGQCIDEYASAEGITQATVKTQLQAVFRKTDTASQKDLVRLVVALPVAREC